MFYLYSDKLPALVYHGPNKASQVEGGGVLIGADCAPLHAALPLYPATPLAVCIRLELLAL